MDNDTVALKLASAAVMEIDVAYRLANGPGQFALAGPRDQAWTAYALARQNLLMDGVIVTDAQLDELDALGSELGRAADTNAIATSAVRLAQVLARIALV